jgi:hypothetical protein
MFILRMLFTPTRQPRPPRPAAKQMAQLLLPLLLSSAGGAHGARSGIPSSFAAPSSTCTFTPGRDFAAGGARATGVKDQQGCCDACAASTQCKAAVFAMGGGQAYCYLKYDLSKPIKCTNGCVACTPSGGPPPPSPPSPPAPPPTPSPPAPPPAQCACTPGKDYGGPGKQSPLGTTQALCCSACAGDPQCKAATFLHTPTFTGCFFKFSLAQPISCTNGCISCVPGGKPPPPPAPLPPAPPVPAACRTYLDQPGLHNTSAFRNAQAFGAKGDGATDDTDAINRALSLGRNMEAKLTTQPAIVYLPPGTYVVSATLQLAFYTFVQGNPLCRPKLVWAGHGEVGDRRPCMMP